MSSNKADPAWVMPEWFIVRELDDELLVYDLRNHQVTSLNAFAAEVWRACPGAADTRAIAARLTERGLLADPEAIALTLNLLGEAKLLEGPPPGLTVKPGQSRREALSRIAFGGAAAAAVAGVVTILAPTPAGAASSPCGVCAAPTPICDIWEPPYNQCVMCVNNNECIDPLYSQCLGNNCEGAGF